MLPYLRCATVNNYCYGRLQKMANLPPRKNSTSSKTSKQDSSPLQILLQMGFTKHRALKALAATGNRSVQLASDWLLTHVNDAFLDEDDPREYILYANPTGPLLTQLLEFWEKSKIIGWNGAHNCPPHITLVPFFKAPNEKSLQLAKAVKPVVEKAGDPPVSSPIWEPYVSPNFMGLFLSEEHSDYLSCIAAEYIKHVSAGSSISLESHVKSLHITLAYHFEDAAFDSLKKLVEELQPAEMSNWELRLYSRDPRFVNHQVYKVTQGYEPKASDELELVLGDYIYVEQKELDNSPDGWVHGTSWLTGVSGYLPAVYTTGTAESDAWTLHRAMSLTSNMNSDKSESDSATETEGEAGAVSAHDVQFARDQSEQSHREWHQYWNHVQFHKSVSFLDVTNGTTCDWKMNTHTNGDTEKRTIDQEVKSGVSNGSKGDQRWILSMRHGERMDLTYGQWVHYCFDKTGTYQRKDLNMPLTLPERAGGAERFGRDTPLTRVGRLQAWLVGEAMRLARIPLRHVYCSPALRCIETAQAMLQGLEADKAIAIRVEPGLFEFKKWHNAKGMVPFMTLNELHRAGFNVDFSYKPYVDLDVTSSEELDEWYERSEKVFQSAVKDTSAEGGNIMFVGHAATLDLMAVTLRRLDADPTETPAPYQINQHLDRVPYCALAAMQDQPFQLVCPPVPPSINSSSGRFDWKMLLDI